MRMAVPCSRQTSISLASSALALSWSAWKFPGLMRTFSTTGATAMAVSEEKWMSAARGIPQPASLSLRCISRMLSTSLSPGTVMRTSCAPASASLRHWATVASMSEVWVSHIDCTTIGASPPIVRDSPILTGIVLSRSIYGIVCLLPYCPSCLSVALRKLEVQPYGSYDVQRVGVFVEIPAGVVGLVQARP